MSVRIASWRVRRGYGLGSGGGCSGRILLLGSFFLWFGPNGRCVSLRLGNGGTVDYALWANALAVALEAVV